MSMKHTPGPWYVSQNEHNQDIGDALMGPSIMSADDGWFICRMEDGPLQQADARLIAAAPDLLAALQEIIAGVARLDGAISPDDADSALAGLIIDAEQARAAIQKATTGNV